MAVYHSSPRTDLKKGFILGVMLLQLLLISAMCIYALESYRVQIRLADNYLSFYEKNVALENAVIQAQQPRQLITSLPCLSAQFYQITVQAQPLRLAKIIAVPYHGECKGKQVAIRYGVQAIYNLANSSA